MDGYTYDEDELAGGAERLGRIGDELAGAPFRRFGMEPGEARHERLAAAIARLQEAATTASDGLIADVREAGRRLDATLVRYRNADETVAAVIRGTSGPAD